MSVRNPDAPAGQPPKRIGPEDVEKIVELKLLGYTDREAAEKVGVHRDTVRNRWSQWLDETTEERRASLERGRSRVLARLDRSASLAMRDAEDPALSASDRISARAVAVRADKEFSRIAGFDAPKQVQLTAAVTMSEAEALAVLNEDET